MNKKEFVLSGKRLQLIKERIHELGYTIPISIFRIKRFRGVGYCTIQELIKIGVVKEYDADDLSIRARNCLNSIGIKTKEQAVEAINDGRLHPDNNPIKQIAVRNYGWKTHKEVCKWLGLPEPHKAKTVQFCPHCGKHILKMLKPIL